MLNIYHHLYHQEEIIEEQLAALNFAQERGLWVRNFEGLGTHRLVGGYEHRLCLNTKSGRLFKANNLANVQQRLSNLLRKIQLHNLIFPETAYRYKGFCSLHAESRFDGSIGVVLEQQFLPGLSKPEPYEIERFMGSLGFWQTTPESFRSGDFVVYDLYPRNVLKDRAGNLFVVDAEFRYIPDVEEGRDETFDFEKELHRAFGEDQEQLPGLPATLASKSERLLKVAEAVEYQGLDWSKEIKRQRENAFD